MKAAILKDIKRPLVVEDVPVPQIGPDDVLVETCSCGICRTDLHIQDGLAYVPKLPHIPGHEPAGVVAAVGSRVRDIQVGQRVVPHLFVTCGRCLYCRTGRDAQCAHVEGILGVTMPGAFAEFFAVPARNLVALPDSVGLDSAGLVSCAVITALHAFRRARLGVGDATVVIGAGGIGLILVQILKAAGMRVAVVSRSPESLLLAAQCDADLMVPAESANGNSQLDAFANSQGAAAIFDCVGSAETMRRAGHLAARGGQIIVIGEEPEFPAIETTEIAQRELEIIGSRNGSLQDAVDAVAMLDAGTIRPPIAHRVTLEEINEGLELLRSGQAHGRVVVTIK